MILEQGLHDHLEEHVSASIYPQWPGQELPAVVYRLNSDPVSMSLHGIEQIREPRFEIDCYANEYMAAKELSQEVIDTLHQLTGSLGSFPVQRVVLENRRDSDEEEAPPHRLGLTFVVYHA